MLQLRMGHHQGEKNVRDRTSTIKSTTDAFHHVKNIASPDTVWSVQH